MIFIELVDGKNKNIAYAPTDGISYDPAEEKYWESQALLKEIERTFEICHGCRLCFKYCDSFPTLFGRLDEKYDGDVRKLTADDTDAVMSACFQCKLCEVQCPYTEREHHEFRLDFPKLVHRYTAQQTKRTGLTIRDRVLGNPDRAAAAARASLGMANLANRVRLHRVFLEKVLGIHRDKLLPDFAPTTFEKWAKTAGKLASGPGCEAVLFQTCYVQNNEPQLGRDTVDVFERNQVDLRCVEGLQCCGMPAWERGDLDSLRKQAAANLRILLPFVEKGAKVVAINPTCSMMMRREHPALVDPDERAAAEKVAAAVTDPSEFLWAIRNEPRFNTDFRSTPGASIAYHAPCHLRAQAVGFKGRDLLRKIPGVVPHTVMECSGHDGTWAMTVEGFEPSARIGKKAFDGMNDANAGVWVTDCPLAALQFAQHAGVRPMHP
ncbi:MAG TPA: heterodisulfide reductase-related iron-sulfur binding cluster, partial [Blastocatellia bacterium]|nr:heterodisulfide reductase-related iron-sulfur binding cluster [Blastocatellia bacterium]